MSIFVFLSFKMYIVVDDTVSLNIPTSVHFQSLCQRPWHKCCFTQCIACPSRQHDKVALSTCEMRLRKVQQPVCSIKSQAHTCGPKSRSVARASVCICVRTRLCVNGKSKHCLEALISEASVQNKMSQFRLPRKTTIEMQNTKHAFLFQRDVLDVGIFLIKLKLSCTNSECG